MPRHQQVPAPMKTPLPRPGRALLPATAALLLAAAIPGLAAAQVATPTTSAPPPAPAPAPAPAMMQAPTASVPPSAPPAATPPASADLGTGTGTFQSKVGKEKAAKIEARITRLHAALRITPQQEPLWQNFAAVMRQNVVQLDAVYAEREKLYGTMNAVQDLQSYAAVQEASARNVQMLLPPFQALYDSLSPEQRKAADATFQHNTNRALQKAG